jgi:hypothetical protein
MILLQLCMLLAFIFLVEPKKEIFAFPPNKENLEFAYGTILSIVCEHMRFSNQQILKVISIFGYILSDLYYPGDKGYSYALKALDFLEPLL